MINKSKIIKKNNDKSTHGLFLEIICFAIPIIVVYLIATYVIAVTVVQSGSMEPTLMTGNTVFYNRLSYINKSPERGDIVLFYSDEYSAYMAKRIIGLSGDSIYFTNESVYINGQLLDESDYLEDDIKTRGIIFVHNTATDEVTAKGNDFYIIPDNAYFMMGDNREMSSDSRYWNEPYIPMDKIVGKYLGQIDFSFQFDVFHQIP